MFERLKGLGAQLMRRLPPLPGPPDPAEDRDAGVRQPRRSGPGDRNSAVALIEPDPDQFVAAIGKANPFDAKPWTSTRSGL